MNTAGAAPAELLGAAFLGRCRELADECVRTGKLGSDEFDAFDQAVLLGLPSLCLLESVEPVEHRNADVAQTIRAFAAHCGLLTDLVHLEKQLSQLSQSDLRRVRAALVQDESDEKGASPIIRQLAGAFRHLAVRISQRAEFKLNYHDLVLRPFQSPAVAAACPPSSPRRRGVIAEGPHGPVLVDFRFRNRPQDDRLTAHLVSYAVRIVAIVLGLWVVAALGLVATAVGAYSWTAQWIAPSRAASCVPFRGAPSVQFLRAPRHALAFS